MKLPNNGFECNAVVERRLYRAAAAENKKVPDGVVVRKVVTAKKPGAQREDDITEGQK
ncbi:MAG: hypothetical protein KUG83_05820 [Gammaproteobacteria bacterium]|nr:hypothetical protein [Gammaproteobacteria bacterium]